MQQLKDLGLYSLLRYLAFKYLAFNEHISEWNYNCSNDLVGVLTYIIMLKFRTTCDRHLERTDFNSRGPKRQTSC